MIIARKLFSQIGKYLKSRQAIVITGLRRVGKTTLLKHFYEKIPSPNKVFLDLEDPLNQTLFSQKNYGQVKNSLEKLGLKLSQKAYLFLDEIQSVPNLPSVVKYFYDHYPIKFFLTGSASFYLKNLFSESLAGRKYLFELFPLDFEEFLHFKKLPYRLPGFEEKINHHLHSLFTPLLEEYLYWGGMPEIALLENSAEKRLALRDIFSSYFQKEVQALGDFRRNETVKDLIFLLAKRAGQKIDIQRLANELKVSRQTIYEYLDFLSGTYFISLIPALGETDVSARKQKKVYLADTGFFNLSETRISGAIFENAVFQTLRSEGDIYYFQKREQEIDFILKISAKEKWAFEVKETATSADLTTVKRRAQSLGLKRAYVVSLNFSEQKGVKYLFQLSKAVS